MPERFVGKDFKNMRVITVHIPVVYIEAIERMISAGVVANRAEYIRFLLYKELQSHGHFEDLINHPSERLDEPSE